MAKSYFVFFNNKVYTLSVIWKLSEGRLFRDRGVELIKEESSFEWDDQTLKRYSGLETQYWYGENFLSSGLLKIKDEEGSDVYSASARCRLGRNNSLLTILMGKSFELLVPFLYL